VLTYASVRERLPNGLLLRKSASKISPMHGPSVTNQIGKATESYINRAPASEGEVPAVRTGMTAQTIVPGTCSAPVAFRLWGQCFGWEGWTLCQPEEGNFTFYLLFPWNYLSVVDCGEGPKFCGQGISQNSTPIAPLPIAAGCAGEIHPRFTA